MKTISDWKSDPAYSTRKWKNHANALLPARAAPRPRARCSPRALLPSPLTPHPSPLTSHLSRTPEPCQRAKLTHSALRCAPRARLGRAPWACGRGVRPLRTIPFLMRLCGFRLNSCSPQTGRQWGAFFNQIGERQSYMRIFGGPCGSTSLVGAQLWAGV